MAKQVSQHVKCAYSFIPAPCLLALFSPQLFYNNSLQTLDRHRWMDGWMTCDFTSFSTVFQSSGQWADDNEMLCAMEPRLWLRRFHVERGSNSDRYISRPALNLLSYWGSLDWLRGGRVVRWCWVNFQCRGVLLIWIRGGQGPTVLAVGAGGGCLDIFTLVYHFFSFSLSLGDGPIWTEILSQRAVKPKTTNQPTNQ